MLFKHIQSVDFLRCTYKKVVALPALHPRTTPTEARGDIGAIVSDDEPGTPRRSSVRVMQYACAWLLELGLPGIARRAFAVAEESERLATKKAKVKGI